MEFAIAQAPSNWLPTKLGAAANLMNDAPACGRPRFEPLKLIVAPEERVRLAKVIVAVLKAAFPGTPLTFKRFDPRGRLSAPSVSLADVLKRGL